MQRGSLRLHRGLRGRTRLRGGADLLRHGHRRPPGRQLNYGACERACASPPNTTVACASGVCGAPVCDARFADCNLRNLADGCESNLATGKRRLRRLRARLRRWIRVSGGRVRAVGAPAPRARSTLG
ncbi:MAG: hypothetical protein R3A48_14320 [Polyangiales bacterium]